ncbi:MAG: helix-turn-helix transcriptional regulator [Flavobacteriales bacterium]|nr:helix-turn-helix transcriptional regulator [Flavobacteriales bacterium]
MNIGQNLRKIRELKGYSQEYIAKALEISQRNYSRIEQNEVEITFTKLQKISEVLEVTPQQILGFDEKIIFQNCTNAFGFNANYYACSEQEKKQYQQQIEHLKGEVIFLRNQVETLSNQRS